MKFKCGSKFLNKYRKKLSQTKVATLRPYYFENHKVQCSIISINDPHFLLVFFMCLKGIFLFPSLHGISDNFRDFNLSMIFSQEPKHFSQIRIQSIHLIFLKHDRLLFSPLILITPNIQMALVVPEVTEHPFSNTTRVSKVVKTSELGPNVYRFFGNNVFIWTHSSSN